MDSSAYRERTLTGATGIELIIALYDGAIRFLYRAIQCVEEDDVRGRRLAVKKATDVLMYLQARLRPQVAPSAAAALSDFYAAMFTMTLEASHAASRPQFLNVISCVRNVREAWAVAAKDPLVGKVLSRELRTSEETVSLSLTRQEPYDGEAGGSRWQA